MTKPAFCHWCEKPVKVKDTFNHKKNIVFCGRGCKDAETLFRMFYNSEEMNRRAHYQATMRGLADGQD